MPDWLKDLLGQASALVLLLGAIGGGIAWIFKKRKELRVERAEEELTYTGRLEKRLNSLMDENQRILDELIQARAALAGDRIPPNEVLRSIVRADELGLMWAKERVAEFKFNMVAVSPAYAREFLGGPPEMYEGRRDADIWPEEVAAAFAANDEAAHKTQQTVAVKEKVQGGGTNAAGMFIGRKFPVRLGDRDFIIGIGELIRDGEDRPDPSYHNGFKG